MNLWVGHLVAAVIHTAMFIVAAYYVYKDSSGLEVEISNPPGPSFWFRVKSLVPYFPLLSTCNHALFLCGYRSPAIRWIEYSLSAGLMFVILGMLSGIGDSRALLLMIGANVALQFTGYASEIGPGGYSSITDSRSGEPVAISVGFVVFLFMQSTIILSYITVVTHKTGVPALVHVIILFMTLAMLSFGILAAVRMSNIARAWGYIALSIVSKTFLANAILFGSLRTEET